MQPGDPTELGVVLLALWVEASQQVQLAVPSSRNFLLSPYSRRRLMQNSWMEDPLRYSWSNVANCWISWEDSFVRSYKHKGAAVSASRSRRTGTQRRRSYRGHVVLQQLRRRRAQLAFARSFGLRGRRAGGGAFFCLHRAQERTGRPTRPRHNKHRNAESAEGPEGPAPTRVALQCSGLLLKRLLLVHFA